MPMKEKLLTTVFVLLVGVSGFLAGRVDVTPAAESGPVTIPQVSVIELNQVVGDQLIITVDGPARVTWTGNKMVEGSGEYAISLAQLADANDRALTEYRFVGNEESGKFYAADTYHARGTKVSARRYFATRKEAEAAGFVEGG